MTKKKALIYLVIFIVLVGLTLIWKHFYLQDPTKKLAAPCQMVVSPACQAYIMDISLKGKYDEALEIQKIRIKENESVLKFYKRKITDKCLFQMTAKEAEDSLYACIGTQKGKRDYYLLRTAEFTVRDIIIDSLAVSQIQYSEFKDKKAAIKTLKHAKKILKQNKYVSNRDLMFDVINKELSELK